MVDIKDSYRKPINSTERKTRLAERGNKTLYPYYGATGQVDYIDDYLLDGEFILLGEDGAPFLDKYAAKAYKVSGKIWVNNHAHILKSICIDLNFLLAILNGMDYKPYVSGSTRLKLTQETMRSVPISLPPLAEQQRIVSKIEELFYSLDSISQSLAD